MKIELKNKFVYFLHNKMYINVTNLCTNNCVFCIRDLNNNVNGTNLRLENENFEAKDIIDEIRQNSNEINDEVVFCGYGEPLIKLEIVKEVAKFIKTNYPQVAVRINTNGQANLIHKRNIIPELTGLIDKISVSLNAETADLYQQLAQPKFDKDKAFKGVKDFISGCRKYKIDVTATVVTGFGDYKIDVEKCREIAEKLDAKFKIRKWLDEGYQVAKPPS